MAKAQQGLNNPKKNNRKSASAGKGLVL